MTRRGRSSNSPESLASPAGSSQPRLLRRRNELAGSERTEPPAPLCETRGSSSPRGTRTPTPPPTATAGLRSRRAASPRPTTRCRRGRPVRKCPQGALAPEPPPSPHPSPPLAQAARPAVCPAPRVCTPSARAGRGTRSSPCGRSPPTERVMRVARATRVAAKRRVARRSRAFVVPCAADLRRAHGRPRCSATPSRTSRPGGARTPAPSPRA